jgi:toxin ParE1/3/4
MKLRFTSRAAQDPVAIADYLNARNAHAAQHVRAAILRSLQNLILFPKVGRAQSVEGVRKLVIRRYTKVLEISRPSAEVDRHACETI